MEYTKGEWKAKKTTVVIPSKHDSNMTDFVVAQTDIYCSVEGKEAEANARLISAAPDMYEALRALSFQFASAVEKPYSKDKEIYEQAQKALAKAEGKEIK